MTFKKFLEDKNTENFTFMTAMGSKYILHNDNTTTRYKEPREEHKGDYGWKEKTEKTIYVKSDQAPLLSAAGIENLKKQRIILKDNLASLISWNDQANKFGRFPSSSNIPFILVPKIGYSPIELWNNLMYLLI